MSNNQSGGSLWPFVIFIFVCATLVQIIFGGASSSSSYTPPRDNLFERRYVEERFKQEGYSRAESAQAADAILKFQRAQETRRSQ